MGKTFPTFPGPIFCSTSIKTGNNNNKYGQ
jgi:hypothetical protein